MSYSIVVAGSTDRTRLCAETLQTDDRFEIAGVLTPSPKAVGRKQTITRNPLHVWAKTHSVPVTLVENKINEEVKERLQVKVQRPQILLVVDFGYIVPSWLLQWPTIAPINIHPSDLPKYRGSSPGQFALIFGEKKSAVTIIVMDKQLDHGPIITKLPFTIGPTWTAPDYYNYAFTLITKDLGNVLESYTADPKSTPQPDETPAPIARMLKRNDGFIPLETLKSILHDEMAKTPISFLEHYSLASNPYTLFCLWRGFHPWPGLWTIEDGKRVKLLQFHMEKDKIVCDLIQIEGERPKRP